VVASLKPICFLVWMLHGAALTERNPAYFFGDMQPLA
jgi:hypothetical protein